VYIHDVNDNDDDDDDDDDDGKDDAVGYEETIYTGGGEGVSDGGFLFEGIIKKGYYGLSPVRIMGA